MSHDKQAIRFDRLVPDGDSRERLVCASCGFVQYENPKVVVGSVVTWEGKVLLGRRAIEPQVGYWTIPAGYLEEGESAEDGARREAWEEMRARLEMEGLLAVYSIPRISQVQLIYKASLIDGAAEAAEETQVVRLFAWDAIPWDDLAFPSVRWALEYALQLRGQSQWMPGSNPPGETGDYAGATDSTDSTDATG